MDTQGGRAALLGVGRPRAMYNGPNLGPKPLHLSRNPWKVVLTLEAIIGLQATQPKVGWPNQELVHFTNPLHTKETHLGVIPCISKMMVPMKRQYEAMLPLSWIHGPTPTAEEEFYNDQNLYPTQCELHCTNSRWMAEVPRLGRPT